MLVGIILHSMRATRYPKLNPWLTHISRLTSCAFQFMFGKLYHLFPIKSVYLASVVIFELGNLLAGVAPSSSVLILGRAISGVGCSGIICGVLTLVLSVLNSVEKTQLIPI